MDWNAAIETNREALKRVLVALVGMAALTGGGATLSRHLYRAILKLLRPAEAAVRRLIIVAARGLSVALPPARLRRPKPKKIHRRRVGRAGRPMPEDNSRVPQLPLLDPLRPWNGRPARRRVKPASIPRISMLDFYTPFQPLPRPRSQDDPVNAVRLGLRLKALTAALDDLPAQAKRFARWQARRDAALAKVKEGRDLAGTQNDKAGGARRFHRIWPLKPGHPPGWRRKPVHEVHDILNDVHGLAFDVLQHPDTS